MRVGPPGGLTTDRKPPTTSILSARPRSPRESASDAPPQPSSLTLMTSRSAAVRQGVPPETVELLSYLFREVLDGRNARLANGVQRALGRQPRDFASYARRTAASGVWNIPAACGAAGTASSPIPG